MLTEKHIFHIFHHCCYFSLKLKNMSYPLILHRLSLIFSRCRGAILGTGQYHSCCMVQLCFHYICFEACRSFSNKETVQGSQKHLLQKKIYLSRTFNHTPIHTQTHFRENFSTMSKLGLTPPPYWINQTFLFYCMLFHFYFLI